ncbi:venom serine carboxypeptidase [Copidosoma floridanum]|uniref:venom serine carboxypeptidase n=1 Tax=Copidosoma floridanum TaxID=29053 RepID=UPI0006C97D74|nr:venom serine carboxypeptidase [Copidosoma floridanum]
MSAVKSSNMPLCMLLLLCLLCNAANGFINLYPKLKTYPLPEGADVGNPLFLTPIIESGDINKARELASVQHKAMKDVSSYAGYFTVNKEYNSNLFFWFFPAQKNPKTAPVVAWFQGGPGASSLFGLFVENGPFRVTKNLTLQARKYSWNANHNVLYIDNPVGTGFSFTDNDLGYARNETCVGRDVHTALVQFFNLFPELQQNEFYVTGESYAGKYVPAISHAIKDYNIKAKVKINLKGLAIGNGFTDPLNQLIYSDYLYQVGLLDANGRDEFRKYENKGREFIRQGKYMEAFTVFDRMIDGDMSGEPSLFKNLTGFDFYFNYLHTKDSNSSNWFAEFVQKPEIRKAIHVGNCSYGLESKKVMEYLREDIPRSAAFFVSDLLQHFKILIYNGQLDIIVAYPLTENYLQNLEWPGAQEYKKAPRKQWWVEDQLAGYSKTVGNLTEVLVRAAGHMAPSDQPKWVFDMITRLTHHKPF